MATNNNVLNVQFLRNQTPLATREAALSALETAKADALDGSALLARYTDESVVKTLVGYVYVNGATHDITIFDIDGASEEVEELRQEILDILGDGVSSANTVTDQLTALSGDSSTDTSATTSVEGAKKYADDLIGTLDGGVTAETGYYVKSVSEVDGKISGTTEALPSVTDTAVAKNFITQVTETNGEIAVTRGSITSSGETIVLTDNEDGGVNFEVHYDGTTIIQDPSTKELKVASSALIQYVGDEDTIHISEVAGDSKTVSSLLTIQKVTTGLSEIVKEEYHLVGASGNTIGAPVQIYKDSHIVSITYITEGEHAQNLEYVYIDASGNTQTTYVDMSELVLEAEFASGVTVTDGIAHGVVDPQSESDSENTAFLTVGADGFKIDGIKDEIAAQLDDVVADLDANVSGNSTHVTVGVEEVDGVISAVTVSEDNIANADDLAELSGKTVTAITSTNGSISAVIDEAIGNKSYDIETDASKIKMSGFTSTDVLSGITEDDTITEAFGKLDAVITENEEITAEALTDLDSRIKTVSGDVETISGKVETLTTNSISAITVNSSSVPVTNGTAPLVIDSATSAMTADSTEAIVVDTDANGNITLGISSIDCGYYS